jgi:hypothetical protein
MMNNTMVNEITHFARIVKTYFTMVISTKLFTRIKHSNLQISPIFWNLVNTNFDELYFGN